jgi:hypothetical protein
MDQQLGQKLKAMEQAEGDARVNAMAEVVRALVEQRQQMHNMRERMMNQMMGHMGEHMGMGMEGEARGMMMHCPMMRMQQKDGEGSGASAG